MPIGAGNEPDRNVYVQQINSFADQILSEWRTAEEPCRIVCTEPPDSIVIKTDRSFDCVINKCGDFVWNVMVYSVDLRLWQIGLAASGPKEVFTLQSVTNDCYASGILRSTEWVDEMFPQPVSYNPNLLYPRPRTYYLTIHLAVPEYGTYSGYLFLDFGGRPVILCKLCVDCVQPSDQLRLYYATKNQLSLVAERWVGGKVNYFPYTPTYVAWSYEKEKNIAIYPSPNEHNFMLTSATLIETKLTLENYRRRMHELITLEEIARYDQIARYNTVGCLTLLKDIVKDGVRLINHITLYGMLCLSRELTEDTKSGRLFLMGCNKALVFFLKERNDSKSGVLPEPLGVFELHIVQKNVDEVYFKLPKMCVEKLNLQANTCVPVQVQFVLDRSPICNYHRAVDIFPDLTRLFVHDTNVPSILNIIANNTARFDEEWDAELRNVCLNEDQKRAVAVMTAPIDAPPLPPILVLGPFGTGKTFTIAHALRMLLMSNPKHRILLCTQSNSAADLYVTDFFHEWYTRDRERYKRLKPTRVYYRARHTSTVDPVVRTYCLTDHSGAFREPTELDLRDCGLIVTTLAMSAAITKLKFNPTHIVIDEAAQAMECEVLMPLSTITPETRIILAGDHMQLAPEVYSDLARKCGLGLTLLERIFNAYPENHPCRIHLKRNYRAHSDIIAFTSEVIYKSDIKPTENSIQPHPYLKPLCFFSVPSLHTVYTKNTGYVNAAEAKEIAIQVGRLRDNWPTDRWGAYTVGSIGVLAPYNEQVRLIRLELRKADLSEVSVEPVRNAQGKQFTAVFISTVRNAHNSSRVYAEKNVKDYSLLTNQRMVNTAITRAKCLVAVFGDPVALITTGECRELWKRYLQLASLHGIKWQTIWRITTDIERSYVNNMELSPAAPEFFPKYLLAPCIHNPGGKHSSASLGT